MGGEVVRERQSYSKSPGHVHTELAVEINGKLRRAARYDPEVIAALAQMEAAGISRSQIRDGMFNLLQDKPPGPGFDQNSDARGQLAAITRLLFVVEPARNASSAATSMMAISSAGDDQTTMAEAVTTNNPMHHKGAGQKGRSGYSVLEGEHVPEATRLEGTQWQLAERETVVVYLEGLLRTKQLTFTTPWEVERYLREEFRAHLLKRLRALMIGTPADD